MTGLENIRKLVHENMMPALERCCVILSRLSGIARYEGPNGTMGYSSHQINLIMDTVSCLNLVSAKILISVVEEIELFTAFSFWLRHEIDRLASAGSANAEELVEKESSIDHAKVLKYIQTSLPTCNLAIYFQSVTSEDYEKDWEVAEQGLPLFELLNKQLRKQELGQPYMKALPRVEFLSKYLERQASTVFLQVAETEKRNVLFGQPIELTASGQHNRIALMMCSKV